jgi:hypothetical protein
MKHCPACNFSFPDFHRVCDFDGTELVPDDARPPIKSPARASRLRSFSRHPKSLTAIALLGLFLISAAIAYLASPARTIPEVKNRPWPESIGPSSPKTASTPESINDSDKLAIAPATVQRKHAATSKALARNQRKASQTLPEVASRKDAKSAQENNDPKLVAVLKTTWRVLTKPFRF